MLLFAKAAGAIPVPKGLDTCAPLSACLTLLDKVVPAQDDGEDSNSAILARDLRRFGEPCEAGAIKACGWKPRRLAECRWRNIGRLGRLDG